MFPFPELCATLCDFLWIWSCSATSKFLKIFCNRSDFEHVDMFFHLIAKFRGLNCIKKNNYLTSRSPNEVFFTLKNN